jgi:septum formation protein
MSKNDVLYIASQSRARQSLLSFAGIAFHVLEHGSDENVVYDGGDFAAYVVAIAQGKMQAVVLPTRQAVGSDDMFMLTADTLVRSTKNGQILGKPGNRERALQMLALECQAPIEVMTGCCIQKLHYHDGEWRVIAHETISSSSIIEFIVDTDSVDDYLTREPIAIHCAGGAIIEDVGLSYLKSIKGSFSGTMGLPLYEVRMILRRLGFKLS